MKYSKYFKHEIIDYSTQTIFTSWSQEYYLDCILDYEFGDDIDKHVIKKERIIDKHGVKMTKYTITKSAIEALKKYGID